MFANAASWTSVIMTVNKEIQCINNILKVQNGSQHLKGGSTVYSQYEVMMMMMMMMTFTSIQSYFKLLVSLCSRMNKKRKITSYVNKT